MPRQPDRYEVDPGDHLVARVVRPWNERKHHYLRRYMSIFATGMKRWHERIYLDLFAGPGRCVWRGQPTDGSPLIALNYPFTRFVFVEKNADAAVALTARLEARQERRPWTVIPANCNDAVKDILAVLPTHRDQITFLLADPSNWQLHFDTIRTLAVGRRLDILLTFMSGLMKRVPSDPRYTRDLDDFFGGEAWRSLAPRTLFNLVNLYRQNLAAISYVPTLPKVEIIVRTRTLAPLYQLAFFAKHPKGYEYWDKISGTDEAGQTTLDFE